MDTVTKEISLTFYQLETLTVNDFSNLIDSVDKLTNSVDKLTSAVDKLTSDI